ncbi:MAG: signal peptidase I [Omnitrophica WOR_2 bacterium RIFCSPHIGHO2_01_FULL_49_10]|nr:MAG: signal peptidase I [Omnitrophica WOR_2 bacterium RIFCSPHIGHO2_01_FULL_49_10]
MLFFLFVISPSQLIGSYVKSNVIEAYKIPSGTMMPTLMIGDRIFVNKTIYKQSEPKRGDVAVFIAPDKFDKNYIKRVVGLPGETIEIKDGKALINGVVITEPAVFRKNHYYNAGEYAKAGQPVKIPEDSYFVLGDNSSSSKDSRYFGFVPRKSFIGKAFKIYYPFDRSGPIN